MAANTRISSECSGLQLPDAKHLGNDIPAGSTAVAAAVVARTLPPHSQQAQTRGLVNETSSWIIPCNYNLLILDPITQKPNLSPNVLYPYEGERREIIKMTPLQIACYEVREDIAMELLNVANIDVDMKDSDDNTALIIAAANGLSRVVKRLLTLGANVNSRNKFGETALIQACLGGEVFGGIRYVEIADLLLEVRNIDVNVQDRNGHNALMWAVPNYQFNHVVLKLLDLGADVNLRSNEQNITALILAIRLRQEDIAMKLLEKTHKDVLDAQDEDGTTALMEAAFWGLSRVVERLLQSGANLNLRNLSGETALITACNMGNEDIAMNLLNNSTIDVDQKDDLGHTALDYASQKKLSNVVQKLQERRSILD